CEGHHIHHVEHGGPTAIDNLVLLCTRHHHLLHNQRWQAKLLPDASFEVTSPDGTTRTTRPPGSLPLLI
ncbi:MAG TPA: HNH endonuclease signature motif containing protein, partial [Acidimicrobiales bacterium]